MYSIGFLIAIDVHKILQHQYLLILAIEIGYQALRILVLARETRFHCQIGVRKHGKRTKSIGGLIAIDVHKILRHQYLWILAIEIGYQALRILVLARETRFHCQIRVR